MADAQDVRRLALGLPDVVEIPSDGFDFRVAGKGFVFADRGEFVRKGFEDSFRLWEVRWRE